MGRWRLLTKHFAEPIFRRRLAVSGAAVALLGLALPVTVGLVASTGASGSLPTTCGVDADVWQATSGPPADWDTAGDWSQGVVPSSTSDACLPAGNYTVTVTETNATAETVEVLSGATLVIEGNVIPGYGALSATLTASGAVTNTGTIELTEEPGSEGGSANLVDTGGTITNAGTISTTLAPADTGSARVINAAFDNEGTLSVAAPTTFTNQGTAITDEAGGSITTAPGAVLSLGQSGAPAGPDVILAGGSVSNQGTIVQFGGALTHASGTATGNPIQLNNVALNPSLGGGTGTGSASFEAFGTANTLTGNVAATDTVSVDGYTQPGYANVTGTLTASGPVTNAGTIILTEGVGYDGGILGAGATFVDTTGTVTNTGTISAVPAAGDDGWGRTFDTALDNEGALDLNVPTTTFALAGSTVTDGPGGTITTGVGDLLSIGQSGASGPVDFDLAGGTITNQGTTIQYGGSFTQAAGSTAGNPVQLDNVDLDPSLGGGSGAGAASFALFGGSSTLTGNVPATDTISVDGYTLPGYSNVTGVLTANGPLTNAGTIILTEAVGAPGGILGAGASLDDSSGTITNTGTISSVAAVGDDGWGRSINASVVNEGTLDLAETVSFGLGGGTVVQDSGSTIIDAAVDASTEGGITVDGGTLSGTGTLTGALVNQDGTVSPGLAPTVGTLSIDGPYTQGSSGVLQTVIDGTGAGAYSQLSLTGNATLAGTLAVEPSAAFAAAAENGNTMPVFAYGGTRAGSFAQAGVAPLNTVAPSIGGTVAVGQKLTCSTGSFTDSPTNYTYQWNRNGAAIGSATGNQYVPTLADSGTALTCTVTANGGAPLDGGLGISAVNDDPAQTVNAVVGNAFTALSGQAISAPVSVPAGPVATGNPQISGTVQNGQTLNCSQGVWANSPASFTYVWNRDGSPITSPVPATASSYVVATADDGHSLTCTVTASNADGTASATSTPVSPVPGPVVTGNPQISGTVQNGQTLNCSQGTWNNTPTGFTYVWNRDGSPITSPVPATASSYVVATADDGHSLTCTVTASNADGTASATSTPVSPVPAPVVTGNPQISGTAQSGQTLNCSQGTWNNTPAGFTYVWNRDGSPITSPVPATGSSYVVATADDGHSLTCTVTASNADGSASATSSPFAIPTGIVPVTITTASLPQAVGANAYSQALTACGGNLPSCEYWSTSANSMVNASATPVSPADSFSFSQASGTLPPGLSFSPGGLLSGTPTQTGTYIFSVTATDPIGDASAPAAYSVTVVAGISVTTADGSYHDGGAITAGSVTVSPDGTGPIDSVVTANGSDDHATVAGTAADNQIGVSVTDVGSFCTTDLEIAGASGTVLSTPGIAVDGCGSSASTTAQVVPSGVASAPAVLADDVTHPDVSAAPAVTTPAPATLAAALTGYGTVTATDLATGEILGVGAVTSDGSFNLQVGSGTGPINVTVQGGSYVSELQGMSQATAFTLSALTSAAGAVPATLPITPLESFAQAEAAAEASAGVTSGVPAVPAAGTPDANAASEAAFGFSPAPTAETVVPDFSSQAAGNAEYLMLAAESGLGASPTLTQQSLVQEILAAMEPSSFPSGLPALGPVSVLPIAAGQSLFKSSLATFEAGSSAYIPSLAPAGTPIVQTLPVTPVLPTPPDETSASITRIGPAAFTETITDPDPYIASAPFSSSGTTYTIEVVTNS